MATTIGICHLTLRLPENARMRISIRRIEVTPEQEARAKAGLAEIRRKGLIKLGGPLPTRDAGSRHRCAEANWPSRCE